MVFAEWLVKSLPNPPDVHTAEARAVSDLPINKNDASITVAFLHLHRGAFQRSAQS